MIYPRCKKDNNWYNRPYLCAPGNGLNWVLLRGQENYQPITGWTSDGYPLTVADPTPEYYPGPPLSGQGSEEPDKEGFFAGVGNFVRGIFKLADKGLDTAHLWGVVTVVAVGGGLALWYIPRRGKK